MGGGGNSVIEKDTHISAHTINCLKLLTLKFTQICMWRNTINSITEAVSIMHTHDERH